MKNRNLGLLIIGIALIFFVILFIFKAQLDNVIQLQMKASGGTCFDEQGNCLHQQSNIPFISGLIISFLTLAFGIFLLFFDNIKKEKKIPKKDIANNKETLAKLNTDEKNIYNLIVEAEGTIFQSELVEKTDFSKVKITRILDKLEGKDIIERKRRGMTNVVILKH